MLLLKATLMLTPVKNVSCPSFHPASLVEPNNGEPTVWKEQLALLGEAR